MSGALLGMAALLVASATFSGSEAALFTLRGTHGEDAGEAQLPAIAIPLLRDPQGALTVILFGNLLVNLGFFWAAGTWADRHGGEAAAGLQLAALFALLVCGEIMPKIAAESRPSRWGGLLLPPVWFLHRLFGPLASRLGHRLAAAAAREARGVQEPRVDLRAADALLSSAGTALLPEAERELLGHVLEFGRLRAGALRRPLGETVRVELEEPLARARERLRAAGVPWATVVDSRGEVLGALDATRPLRGARVADAWSAVPVMPELGPVALGVRMLRRSGAPFVLLVDEYGASAGVIERGRWADTLLDKLPEQPAGRLPAVVPLGPGRFQVDASLPLHVFAERFCDPGGADVRLDTLGGLVQERLGRLPRIGDRVRIGGFQSGYDVVVVRSNAQSAVELEVSEVAANDGTPFTHPRAGTE